MKRLIPGKLYRRLADGRLFVPIHRAELLHCGGVWRCLTPDGIESLRLWDGEYQLVEGE